MAVADKQTDLTKIYILIIDAVATGWLRNMCLINFSQ